MTTAESGTPVTGEERPIGTEGLFRILLVMEDGTAFVYHRFGDQLTLMRASEQGLSLGAARDLYMS